MQYIVEFSTAVVVECDDPDKVVAVAKRVLAPEGAVEVDRLSAYVREHHDD